VNQPLYLVRDDLIPPFGRDFFTGPQEEGELPYFSMREVASIFFARKHRWLYEQIQAGNHKHPDYRYDVARSKGNHRRFSLHNVEVISHALFMRGIISLNQFSNSIVIIKAIASNYGLMKGNEWSRPPL
jgi:hypothetical protein